MRGLLLVGIAVLLVAGGSIAIGRFIFAGRRQERAPANPTTTPAEKPPGGTLMPAAGGRMESAAPKLPGSGQAPITPLGVAQAVRSMLPSVGVK